MITVPTNPSVPSIAPKVDPTYLAMAAAQMHSMGRLFEPAKLKPDDKAKPDV